MMSTPCDRNQYMHARKVTRPSSRPGPLMPLEFVRSGPTATPVARVSPAPPIHDLPVHPHAASCRSMPADAPTHFGQPSLCTLSPSSCIRLSFPLWTEPTAPPLPVLRRLHHVRPPAAPSAHAAQPQPHTSFLVRAMHCACPCLAGAVCWWCCPSSSPVSAAPTRPRPLHVSGPLFAHAQRVHTIIVRPHPCRHPASLCTGLPTAPGPPVPPPSHHTQGCSTVIQLFCALALLCLFCPQPLSQANVLQFTGWPFPHCSPV